MVKKKNGCLITILTFIIAISGVVFAIFVIRQSIINEEEMYSEPYNIRYLTSNEKSIVSDSCNRAFLNYIIIGQIYSIKNSYHSSYSNIMISLDSCINHSLLNFNYFFIKVIDSNSIRIRIPREYTRYFKYDLIMKPKNDTIFYIYSKNWKKVKAKIDFIGNQKNNYFY